MGYTIFIVVIVGLPRWFGANFQDRGPTMERQLGEAIASDDAGGCLQKETIRKKKKNIIWYYIIL